MTVARTNRLAPGAKGAGSMRLYEISEEMEAIAATLEDNGGELTPELAELLQGWSDAFETKVERVVAVIRNFEATAEAVASEVKRLQALKRSRERAAEGLRVYLRDQMVRASRDEVELPICRVAVRTSSTPTITWEGEGMFPMAYAKVRDPELDKESLKAAWKEGILPDGFKVDFSKYVELR